MLPPGLGPHSPLRRALARPRLTRPPYRALVLDSGYHLQAECARALTALGHRVGRLAMRPDEPAPALLGRLLRALVAQQPDFVLAVNHLGLDTAGTTQGVLDACGVPLAIWYVDCPFFFVPEARLFAFPNTVLYCWEAAFVPLLRAAGAAAVRPLPLGWDRLRLPPQARPQAAAAAAPPRLGFVGDSMAQVVQHWRARLRPAARRRAEGQAALLLRDRRALLPLLEEAAHAPAARRQEAHTTVACATFVATGLYRTALLRAAAAVAPLRLYGDAGWEGRVAGAELRPRVPYGPALAAVYADCDINLNATSLQMPTAVNQRAFDVPGAGGVGLGDRQADGVRLFGDHDATYGDADELAAAVARLRADPVAAAAAAARRQAQVAAAHTYEVRLAALVAGLVAELRPAAPGAAAAPC